MLVMYKDASSRGRGDAHGRGAGKPLPLAFGVVQYARYGDGTTPGLMPHKGGDNATHPNGTHMNGPSLSPFIGSEALCLSVFALQLFRFYH